MSINIPGLLLLESYLTLDLNGWYTGPMQAYGLLRDGTHSQFPKQLGGVSGEPVVKTMRSFAWGRGSSPGLGTKILHVMWGHDQKNKNYSKDWNEAIWRKNNIEKHWRDT